MSGFPIATDDRLRNEHHSLIEMYEDHNTQIVCPLCDYRGGFPGGVWSEVIKTPIQFPETKPANSFCLTRAEIRNWIENL